MEINKILNRSKKIIRKTPFHIILLKIFRRLFNALNDRFQNLFDLNKNTEISNKGFTKFLGLRIIDYSSSTILDTLEIKQVLGSFLRGKDIKFTAGKLSNSEKTEIIKEAEKIISHRFDLLGSGNVEVSYSLKPSGIEGIKYDFKKNKEEIRELKKNLNRKTRLLGITESVYEPINWHIDFKSGYIWDEHIWYKKVKTGHMPGVDIKIPWELSRFQHLIILGQAYAITGDERYTIEFISQMIDWIENNRPQFGVNWKCTMDVAIRVANMIVGLSFFKDSKEVTNDFLIYFLKNIYFHGNHIVNNLEFSSITSNHYLSDIAGLIFVGHIFQESKTGTKWKRFSIRELIKELDKQVLNDGTDFESSTCYHRLVLELFFYSTLTASENRNGNGKIDEARKIFGPGYIEKLLKMFEYLLSVSKPDGKIPQLGDNDNGRFFIYKNQENLDIRYLLTSAAIFFEDSRFKIGEFGISDEVLWLFGEEGYLKWKSLDLSSINNIESKKFEDSGIYIFRNRQNYIAISCGPNGQNGNGGHAHNDKLSFELFLDGESLIIDPGTYIYTPFPDRRNEFRSVKSHNTVCVNKEEQNRFVKDNIFTLENDAVVKVNEWFSSNEFDFLDAEHAGFERLNENVTHRRKFFFNKNSFFFVVKDILSGSGNIQINSCFNFNNSIDVIIDKASFKTEIIGKYNNLQLIVIDNIFNDICKSRSNVSNGYGNMDYSNRVVYSVDSVLPVSNTFIFIEKNTEYNLEDIGNIIRDKVKDF